ncbi:PREDICTED: non-specific lipid-transfer protein 2-like [Ipomoea nil]|uniref:non-specific lipid-transfer protein 2-like n=1 Tax=Ipomoea nil TaxID=35883 RepID=UPI000900FD05|nr:PREDICTED: non-specific lipid-transfer protein 2-like [Ipomoea nil]
MTMRNGSRATLVAVCIMVAAMLIAKPELSMAQEECNTTDLSPCGPVVMSAAEPPPSPQCCSIVKQQSSQCLCEYIRNYPQYADNATKILRACGVAAPTC